MPGEPVATALSSLPPPEAIRSAAQEELARRLYRLDEYGGSPFSGFDQWLGRVLRSFFEWTKGISQALRDVSPVLYYGVIVLLVLLALGGIAHISWTVKHALAARRRRLEPTAPEDPTEGWPETWEERARAAAAQGDYLTALRALFRAALLRLEAARKGTFLRGATNGEYLARFRATPAFDGLSRLAALIERWYAGRDCSREEYQQGEAAHRACQLAAREPERTHAQRT